MNKFLSKAVIMVVVLISLIGLSACSENNNLDSSNHPHNYEIQIISPTCQEQGYTLHKCACGDEYKDSYTPAINHTGTGQCSMCGLNFFDAFKDFIKENGELTDEDYDDISTETCYWFDYVIEEEISNDMIGYDFVYFPQSNRIRVRMNIMRIAGNPLEGILIQNRTTEIDFADALGEYMWRFAINSTAIVGDLDASTGMLYFTQSDSPFGNDTDNAIQEAANNVGHMLNVIDRAVDEYGGKFSMENFGFSDYQN